MLRLAKKEDIDSLFYLNEQLFIVLNELRGDLFNPVGFSKEFIENMITSQDSDYIVIEDDEKIVGYALIEERKSPYKKYNSFIEDHFAYICELVILPEYRLKGYGKQIIEEAVKWAKNRNLTSIELDCLSNNYNARAFYENMEFEEYQIKLRKKI